MNTAKLLTERLEQVYQWYKGMVNPDTGMLEYLYLPEADTFIREKCPIRDIGSVWDVELLSDLLNRHDLDPLIKNSLRHFGEYLVERHGYMLLDSRRLNEPSTIAHSAFMILALLNAPPRHDRQIAALAEGILRQQRSDGSYKIYFHDLPDEGEELYAGEAMLALLETYRHFRDVKYLQSAKRGFRYYDAQYFQLGRLREDLLVFFANWQSQACRLLFELTDDTPLKQDVARYLYRMHERIITRDFYRDVERHPAKQVSVEVACALEGLNDAYALARTSSEEVDRASRYRQCICVALAYLLRLQRTKGGTKRERGGFGLSLQDRRQRIDITGHAASAFIKCMQDGVECERISD